MGMSELQRYALWVLLPTLDTDDPNLQYYYDFEPALAEYKRVFAELGCDWRWRRVRVDSIATVLDEIQVESAGAPPLIVNLCDGDEYNGAPGISVIRELEARRIPYTGARERFYHTTTSKIVMKHALDSAGISTAPWQEIGDDASLAAIFERCGRPLIVKPAVSGGSMGVSVRNVVTDAQQLSATLTELRDGYRGWNLAKGGIFAERFVRGREFTVFVVGSGARARCYAPIELVFHESLAENERFLSFDRLWETFETEAAMPNEDFFYRYAQADASLVSSLQQLSLAAYRAVQGSGYGRVDIRQDAESGALYVLEVNAQCGLSEDENYTAIGAILRFEGQSFTQLTQRMLSDALHEAQLPA